MSTHGHAAAHVADDEIQGLIGLADLLGVALGHGLLVQGVENAAAGDEGVAGVAGQRRQLIHHGGIHDVGGDVQRRADLTGQQAAQVAGMVAVGTLFQGVDHGIGGEVSTAVDRA